MNRIIENRGRVIIIFEAEKIDFNPNFKKNSSTIYYSILKMIVIIDLKLKIFLIGLNLQYC